MAVLGVPPVGRGRPRSAAVHRAILDAALQIYIEVGREGLTMEGVAARAGVAKTTVYRRWSSKDELLLAAVEVPLARATPPETGCVREDLIELVVRMHRLFLSSPVGELMPRMALEIQAGSALGRAYVERVVAPRVVLVQAVITAAVERGQIKTDLDAASVHDMLMGPVVLARTNYRLPKTGIRVRAECIVDALLTGIGTQSC